MANSIIPKYQMDDDTPRVTPPINDALSSAQARRYEKTLLQDSPNDYGYSD